MRALLLIFAVLVAYGSLYPFGFRADDASARLFHARDDLRAARKLMTGAETEYRYPFDQPEPDVDRARLAIDPSHNALEASAAAMQARLERGI